MPKKMLHLPALVLFGIYALYSFCFYPLLEKVSNDIVLANTPVFEFIKILSNLIQWIGLAAAFGFVIHSIYRFSLRKSVPLFILTGGALLFKYVSYAVNFSFIHTSTLNVTSQYFKKLYIPLFWTYVGDCLFVALTALLTYIWVKKHNNKNRQKQNSCNRLHVEFVAEGETLPITKLFKRNNPLLRAAFWGVLSYAILQALSFLVNEIIYGLRYSYYWADFFWSSYGFLTQILIPTALCYPTVVGCIKLSEWYRARLEAREAAEEATAAEDGEQTET